MRSEQLTEAQLESLVASVRPMLRYLGRLEKRMEAQGFPADDRLLRLVRETRQAAHDLALELHYLSCDGVGRPRRQPD
ncbi:MAG: hypothetical protein DWQ37_19020 [Planctomycetota bacterium]|nr:MAG: hypothetical protein DWQ37_19020 [Planctomycetota bacterium]